MFFIICMYCFVADFIAHILFAHLSAHTHAQLVKSQMKNVLKETTCQPENGEIFAKLLISLGGGAKKDGKTMSFSDATATAIVFAVRSNATPNCTELYVSHAYHSYTRAHHSTYSLSHVL